MDRDKEKDEVEESEGDIGAKAVAEGVAAVAWAINSSEFASIVSSTSSTTTSSSPTTTTSSSSLSQPLPATTAQKAKTKKQRKKEKRKEKEKEKEKDKDEREKEKEATTGLRTAIKRALVEGYDKLSENAAAAAAATTNGRTSRLRTHSERAASSPPSQSHSSAESSPSRGAAADQSTGAGAASERRLPSGERERSVTSPPSQTAGGSGRKAAKKASKRSPLGQSEGGSETSSDDEPFSDRGRERAATVTDDLRTGSVILESPRRRHPELALSPRSQSGRDLTSGTQIGGPRHLSVSHKKPTRIPGEKGSKVLRLQCPQGMSCTSADADHFLKFQHTPLTQRTSLLRKRSAENPSVPEGKPACPDGEKCTNAKPSHFLQYDHAPADPPTSSSSAPTSPSISITSSSSTPSPSSSPTSPSFLEKKVFFEKLGMKSRTMRSWRGKEKKKKDKEEKSKLKNDDDLTQRRICALGDECTSTDPHHFLTHQHTILNLDEKVQWINYNNTHSSSIHVSGVSTSEVVDEEVELLTQAKQSSRAAADAEEKENEDEDEERKKKEDEEREEAKREEAKEEVRRRKNESEAKQAEVTHEDKPKEQSKDEPPAISADVSSPQVQITAAQVPNGSDAKEPVPATTEAVEPAVPKLGLGLVPPPVPPKPVQLSPRRPMPAGTTHHVQIVEGPDPPAQNSDLKRLVKAASRHILSREFRTSQLRMNKNSDNLLRRKVESEKRESVVREIVTTERNYIRILQAVLDLYQGPLEAKARAKKKWITEDQVKAIFYQIKVIHGLNSTLLQELEERTDERTWNENSAIGDIFVRMSSFLRVYASYNANYAKALLTIKQCKQQKKFNEFLEAVGKGNEKRKQFVGSDLQSFLITPVQRIPRYIILLKMLREHTMDDHVDFAFINEALEKIQTVATENEKIHETSIQLLYLFQVQKKFVQANELGLVESHRRLIAEAEVVLHKYKIEGGGGGTKGHTSDQPIGEPVRTIGNPHKAHVRKVFVFNDIIIVAKEAVSGKRGTKAEKKRNERKERERERERERAERAGGVALVDDEEEGKWRFMYQVDVETCQVDALEDSFDFISSRYTQKNAIRLSDSASGRVVRFTMTSPEEKQKLLDQLQNVIASFVRSLSSSTASGAAKSPQQNQRSSSYIIPSPGSGGSGAHGLIHSSSSNATQPLSSSPSPSSPIAS